MGKVRSLDEMSLLEQKIMDVGILTLQVIPFEGVIKCILKYMKNETYTPR